MSIQIYTGEARRGLVLDLDDNIVPRAGPRSTTTVDQGQVVTYLQVSRESESEVGSWEIRSQRVAVTVTKLKLK